MKMAIGLRLPLISGVIHVWPAPLDVAPDLAAQLCGHLSPDERARADRFRRERDRHRFVVARGWLRLLLGVHLGADPTALAFVYGPHGKPRLAGRRGTRLEFSLSHSSAVALYALTVDRRVGIDVERVDIKTSWQEVAEAFFSYDEVRTLAALPPEQGRSTFFRLWTRREAWLKAHGEGLAGLGARVAMPALGELPVEPGNWVIAEGRRRWRLVDLDVVSDHAAAVVAEDGPETGVGIAVGPSLEVALGAPDSVETTNRMG